MSTFDVSVRKSIFCDDQGQLTFLSVRFFFLALSSPPAGRFVFKPFSSPGTGPDSRSKAKRAGFGFLKVCRRLVRSQTRFAQHFLDLKRTYKNMLAFIAVLSEVQVVLNGVRLVGGELNGHVKLTPSFLFNAERRLFEHYSDCDSIVSISDPNHRPSSPILRLSSLIRQAKDKERRQLGPIHTLSSTGTKTGVQMESDLVKYGRRNQTALLIHEPDLDMPRSLREALDLRWLISAQEKSSKSANNSKQHVTYYRKGWKVAEGLLWSSRPLRPVRIVIFKPCKQDPSNRHVESPL
jgi:hypothetical protein